jgi:hypothetical protein
MDLWGLISVDRQGQELPELLVDCIGKRRPKLQAEARDGPELRQKASFLRGF